MKAHVITFLSLSFLSASVAPLALAERESGGRVAPLAVEIVFSSPGDGISSESFVGLMTLVQDRLLNGEARKIINTPWGREGERTVCVEFIDYGLAHDFSEASKAVLAKTEPDTERRKTHVTKKYSCEGEMPIVDAPETTDEQAAL